MDELGRLIKHRRTKLNISSRGLSDTLGKSATYVWQLENGNVKNPPYDVLRQVFDALGLDESLLWNHFGFTPPEILEAQERDYEEWYEAEKNHHQAAKEAMVKRLDHMNSDDIDTVLLMLDKYNDVIKAIADLHQYKHSQATESIREYVDFLNKKYLGPDI